MRKVLLLSVVLFAVSSFADTTINNFTGYNDSWAPFGGDARSTQTYGEVFTDPDGVNNLSSFSVYMGHPYYQGNILLGGYVATWTGSHAGDLLYDSGQINYDNAGNERLTFTPSQNVPLTPGNQYVVFLSTSKWYEQSSGGTYVVAGSSDPHLNGFAYYNNGGSFDSLFGSSWDATGLSPDWAVNLDFDQAPEPASLTLLGTGIVGLAGFLRRKL